MKENKGITLIALVITIIVLIILAAVSIAMLSGEDGILNQASKSSDYNAIGEQRDELANKVNLYVSAYYEATYSKGDFASIVGNEKYVTESEDTDSETDTDTNNETKTVPTTVKEAIDAALQDFKSTNSTAVTYSYNNGAPILSGKGYYQQVQSIDDNGAITWSKITKGSAPTSADSGESE